MSKKPLVVVTHRPFPQTLALLEAHADVICNDSDRSWSVEHLRRVGADASALLVFMPDSLRAADLDHFPRLSIVAAALKGYDNFDVDALAARNIWFTIVPDLLTDPTADLGVALLLALGRNLLPADQHVRSGEFTGWQARFYGQGIAGKTVGIIGMGKVGQALARRLHPFGARIVYSETKPVAAELLPPDAQLRTLDQVVAESDYLFPLTHLYAQTRHHVGRERLAQMKPSAFLINIGRGSLVDEAAVADAIESGRLAGYGADVFEMEDWALASRPRRIDARLLAMRDKTVFTPHIGSGVIDIRLAIETYAARNIIAVLGGGEPQGAVRALKQPLPA